MLTLNQIHAQIVALANAHYQIAEVGMGTIAELQGKPDRLYPLLWLSNEGGSLEDNYKVDNIRLTMFGRVIVGEEGQDDDASEIEVLSDMQLILLDFLNYFHQQHGQEYVTDKAATLEHFTERTNDRTAGYSCVLELKQFYDWNKCNIPQSGAVIPPTIDGLTLYDFCDQSVLDRLTAEQNACLLLEFGNCADATVENSDASYSTTVASGATLVLPNITFTDSDGSSSSVPSVQDITATPCSAPSLSIEVYSDSGYSIPVASLAYGATAYIKLVSSDITPTTHTFFFGNGTKNAPQVTQVGSTLAWVVSLTGTITISSTATDGTDATADATPFTLTSTIVITNSLKFDGVNDTTLATPLIRYNQDFSVSFWFKMNSAAVTNSLFSMGIKYNSTRLAITVLYNINNITVMSSGTGWNLNRNVAWAGDTNWHNMVVTNNNSTNEKEVFIDGVSIGVPNSAALSADFDYLMLGYGYNNNYGNVNIADFNIHDSVLTSLQIAALQTVGATSVNSVQRWIFSEPVGTVNGSVTDIVAGQKMNLRNMLAPNGIVADAP